MSLRYINSSLQQLAGELQMSYKQLPAPVVIASTTLFVSYVVHKIFSTTNKRPMNLPPVVPYTVPFIGHGLTMNRDPAKFIQQCKDKYGPIFEIYSYGQKLIVITGKEVVDCFRMGDEYLDFQEGLKELLPTAHIVTVSYGKLKQPEGPDFPWSKHPFVHLVRNNLKSHQIGVFQSRIMDATERGMSKDITFLPGEDSTTVDASVFFQTVVARISAQVFAGEAYADNEPLIQALATFALSVFKASIVQAIFPRTIADFLTRRYMSVGDNIDVIMREVTPHVVDIKQKEDQFGEMEPNDFMHMMLHTPAADDHTHTPEEAAFWMKDIALASIHTTSIYLGLALHDLSDRPDIQDLLRKEMDETREKVGTLTPEAVSQMPILDSFFRESLRIGSDYVGFRHKVMKETVLPSGITLPAGASIGLSVYDAHMDPEMQEIGPNGIPLNEFDPCRFVGRKSKKSTAVGPDLLIFGVGYHSCPGRYFASVEIKYLLASIIDRFDISATTKDGKRAPNRLALGMAMVVPAQHVKFTKRAQRTA
ncbi:unnamed protein product [Umbelopsis ramanniana]